MKSEKLYKKQLKNHLFGGEAFLSLDEILKKISFEQVGIRPKELPYSFYELFFHIWYTQRDILEYCMNTEYSAPKWPRDYWPKENFPANKKVWNDLKDAFFEDREKLVKLLSSEVNVLNKSVPSNNDHTIFREILLVIEHNAYHTGQLLIIQRHLGIST